jgi:hypothetical protein
MIFSRKDERKMPQRINMAVFPALQVGGVCAVISSVTSSTISAYCALSAANCALHIAVSLEALHIVVVVVSTHMRMV